MIKAQFHFPEGFLWGTATSSHQVEGGNHNNEWWDFEQKPGAIVDGSSSGEACDWWAGRWKEDLDRAAQDGHNAHRMSLEWSRIEPKPGTWDEGAINYYREILQGLLERGMLPVVTLHHFTNPRWLIEEGGWQSPETVPRFEAYTNKVVSAFGELVGMWITINEPSIYLALTFITGDFPGEATGLDAAMNAAINMVRGHAAAYQAIHRAHEGAMVGLAHHFRAFRPRSSWNPLDRVLSGVHHRLLNRLVPDALDKGVLRGMSRQIRLPEVKGTQDYFGLNYYTSEQIAFSPEDRETLFSRRELPQDLQVSPGGFIADDPAGFREALVWSRGYGLPMYIMENGVEDDEDTFRRVYLVRHLKELWRAVNFNWKIRGYFHWTLVDNYEWERGWTQRFGLYHLDPATQKRAPRQSAALFSEVVRSNSLSVSLVVQYAPGAAEQLFPGLQVSGYVREV